MQQPPSVNAGADINVCDASTEVALVGSYTGSAGVQWTTNGTGSFLPNASSANATYQPGLNDTQLQNLSLIHI